MADTDERVVYVKQSVSLRRDQVTAISRIASEDKHGKFSRVVQEAVDDLIERRERAEQEARAAA